MPEASFSPGRDYKVSFSSYEVRMSHWIDQPSLIRLRDNVCLFALNEATWSAGAVHWLDPSTVELNLRRYPGLITCTLTLNVLTKEAQAVSRYNSVAGTIPAVIEWLYALS